VLTAHATTVGTADLTNQVNRARKYFYFALPTPTLGFTVTPAVQTLTTSSVTVSFTPSGSCTAYGIAQKRGLTAPSVAQVKAGQDSSGAAAPASANKAVSGADTLVLSGLTKPTYDLYFVLNNGVTDSALSVIASVFFTAPAGKQFIGVVAPGSPTGYSLGDGASPAVVTGDVWVVDTLTPAGFPVFVRTNGEFFYVANFSTAKQTINASFYDLSLDTTPADAQFTVNNALPAQTDGFPQSFNVGTVVDIDMAALYPDPEGDPTTVTKVGTDPTWLSVTANHAVGTAANPGAQTLTIAVSDGTGSATFTHNFTVIQPTAPDVVLLSLASATALLVSQGYSVASTSKGASDQPIGTVIAQKPLAGTNIVIGQAFTLTLSSGPAVNAPTPSVIPRRKGKLRGFLLG
jgi:hypothetical protein